MNFLAQFDLAALPSGASWPAPTSGLVSFFFSTEWNGGGAERGPGVVLLHDAGPLVRRATPRRADRFKPCDVRLRIGLTIPEAQHDAAFLQTWGMTQDEWSAYLDLHSVREDVLGPTKHQLFGHFEACSNDPLVMLQAARTGADPLALHRKKPPAYARFLAEAKSVRPIVRFDEDENAGMAWGDGGLLAFFAVPSAAGPDEVWLFHDAG